MTIDSRWAWDVTFEFEDTEDSGQDMVDAASCALRELASERQVTLALRVEVQELNKLSRESHQHMVNALKELASERQVTRALRGEVQELNKVSQDSHQCMVDALRGLASERQVASALHGKIQELNKLVGCRE